MARNDFSELKTTVTAFLHDTSLSSRAGDWINETIQDIHARTKMIYLHATSQLSVTSGTNLYAFTAIAADVYKIMNIRDTTNDNNLTEISYKDLYSAVPDPTNELSGSPTHFAIQNTNILLFPNPGSDVTLDVDYHKRSVDLSADTDQPTLPIEWNDVIILGAEARGLRFLKRTEWMAAYQLYETEVRRRISQDQSRPTKFRFSRSTISVMPLGPRIKV